MAEILKLPYDIDKAMRLQNAAQNIWLDNPSPENQRRLAYSWELLISLSGRPRRSQPSEPGDVA